MKQLNEGLQYKDLMKIVKPEIHVDEFASNMGNDDNIIVISFHVKGKDASIDLVSWFEKGYEFILDSDKSPGEISPNRYLVFIEMKRRISVAKDLQTILIDLESLTEHTVNDWKVVYGDEEFMYDNETFRNRVILSPHLYRVVNDMDMNILREASGIKTVSSYNADEEILTMQRQARII